MPNTNPNQPQLLDKKFMCILGPSLPLTFFHSEGAAYILIMDDTSRFLIVCKLTSMIGIHVANQCMSVFSEYEWPNTLISNNGPCYT